MPFDKTLETTCYDPTRSNRERLEAAKQLLWVIEHETGLNELELQLAKAIISRSLDGLEAGDPASRELIGFWRTSNLGGSLSPSQVSESHALVIAKLLFDRDESRLAIEYFERAIESHTATAETALLAAYAYERLGRVERDAHAIDRALEILAENHFRHFNGADECLIEAHHCRGHLFILRAQVSDASASGYAHLGTNELRVAAECDPIYTSCYSSAYAERGDYVGTIDASLDVLQRRQFGSLPPEDATTVALEVLFYLAYAFSCVGEYEQARKCFGAFAEHAARLREPEARDHARLFLVKLDLKKRLASELSKQDLNRYYAELRSLSFRSPLSAPVEAETRRYEAVIDFLLTLDITPEFDATQGEDIDLGDAYEAARGVIRTLLRRKFNRPNAPLGCLMIVGKDASVTPPALREFPEMWQVEKAAPEELTRNLVLAGQRFDVLAVMATQGEPEVKEALERLGDWFQRTVLVVGPYESSSGGGHLWFDDESSFMQLATCGVALALSRRFLLDDEYIFGLTPCVNSPATRYQHTNYSLSEIRSFL